MSSADYDAVVIGGGPAGLNAALYLGRSRRRTLVLDGGRPRNVRASHAHGVFTRDGTPPLDLLAEARQQIANYPDAEFRPIEALAVEQQGDGFVVRLSSGEFVEARRLLFACGVIDELPPIPGLADLWGVRVHSCTYCHGYEERDRPLAVLADADNAVAVIAGLLAISRNLILCGQGLSPSDHARLKAHDVPVLDTPLVGIKEAGDGVALSFADGRVLERAALFMKSKPRLSSDLPARLGCDLDGPARVVVSANWETSVPGAYAAGDIAASKKFVAVAAASGVEAAVAIDGALAQEHFGGPWSGPLCGDAARAK